MMVADHSIICKKLFNLGIPNTSTKFLLHWYRNQTVNINFNSFKSAEWTVNNGVRQGGILSPHLFNIYVNELIVYVYWLQPGLS